MSSPPSPPSDDDAQAPYLLFIQKRFFWLIGPFPSEWARMAWHAQASADGLLAGGTRCEPVSLAPAWRQPAHLSPDAALGILTDIHQLAPGLAEAGA